MERLGCKMLSLISDSEKCMLKTKVRYHFYTQQTRKEGRRGEKKKKNKGKKLLESYIRVYH